MSKQRIFIAGHRGMVGSAIRRQLEQRGDVELVLRTRDELNLLDSRAVDAPRDKCTLSCAINGIHAAFHYLKK
ncbi:NAD-dependent epimerase/dehydratase family protein, partial [Escherichia coli]